MNRMLTLGGYLTSRRPISLVREAVRDALPIDELMVPVGCVETDLALGLRSLRRCTIGLISLGVWGLAPTARHRIEAGEVDAVEWGVTSVLRSFQAGGRLEPSIRGRFRPPVFGHPLDDDGLPTTPVYRELPGRRPDVAFLHVPYADPVRGIAWGYGLGVDLIIGAAARSLVISYEVAVESPPNLPNRFVVPRHLVGELRHRPFGAFPTACYPLYGPCAPFYPRYLRLFEERGDAWRDDTLCGDDDRNWVSRFTEGDDLHRTIGFAAAPSEEVATHRRELMQWLMQ